MADPSNRHPENAAGKFYVDTQCIACGTCAQVAPDHFQATADGSYYYVARQPAGPEEEKLVREALESCPTSAIGDDGE